VFCRYQLQIRIYEARDVLPVLNKGVTPVSYCDILGFLGGVAYVRFP
jgi:hypothetical protein